jgi:hypothetical protein
MSYTYLFKLLCGEDELELTDWSIFYPLAEGHEDGGATVTLRLFVQAENRQSARVLELLHRIEVFSQRATEYEDAQIGQPVLLGMKMYDGNRYDTTFGRGWVYKQLLPISGEQAIVVELDKTFDSSYKDAYINGLTLRFNCKSRVGYGGEAVYAWEPQFKKPIGEANGAVTTLPNGGLRTETGLDNLFPNSSFETGVVALAGGWVVEAGLTATPATEATDGPGMVYSGFYSAKLVADASDRTLSFLSVAPSYIFPTIGCISFYARLPSGGPVTTSDVDVYSDGATPSYATVIEASPYPHWYRVYRYFSTAGVSAGCKVKANKTVYVDCFQEDTTYYPTPYAHNDFGRGYSNLPGMYGLLWAASKGGNTQRMVGYVTYPNSIDKTRALCSKESGTILVVWKNVWTTAQLLYMDDFSFLNATGLNIGYVAAEFTATCGGATLTVPAAGLAKNDIVFVLLSYDSTGSTLRVYTDKGSLLGSDTEAYVVPAAYTEIHIGGGPALTKSGVDILEVQIWDEVLTAKEQLDRVLSGYGSAELPFYWHSYTYNSISTLAQRIWEFENVPGDYDAGLELCLTNSGIAAYSHLYWGQMRRAIARADLISKRDYIGCKYIPWLEVESGATSYDGDTTTLALDTSCSGMFCARVFPSSTDNIKRVNVPICNEPEDLWQWCGRWRALVRAKSEVADTFRIQLRAVVGGQPGDFTEQVYADGDNVWRPLPPQKLVFNIPTAYVPLEDIQRYLPDSWDSSVDGPYAYLEVWAQADYVGKPLELDCITLVPQDQEGWAVIENSVWGQNDMLVLDTTSPEFSWGVKGDITYGGRFVGAFDWSGVRPTLPVGRPSAMVFVQRISLAGGAWSTETISMVGTSYKPRYRIVA